MTKSTLAAIVRKTEADPVIEQLRSAGIYDDDRRIVEHDADHLAVPVTESPESIDVSVIDAPDQPRRIRGLESRLRERGFTDDELETVPNSWAVIGDVVLIQLEGCSQPDVVASELLALHDAETVLDRNGIDGEHREPDVEVVAGSGETETIHREHGTAYALDLATVMFSPGNKAERARMGEIVDPDDRVLDMFAGIGYFTLPMARAGAAVTAIERNPTAFRYLIENAKLNEVESRIQSYRADCRDVIAWHHDPEIDVDVTADRVVMGYYDAYEYLDAALPVVAAGGIVHMHAVTPDALLWERPRERLRSAAADCGRAVEILEERTIKTHSEGVYHVVIDARIR
ncbi:MAG: class I SAM-dependent methyltransferase family protein [Halobacteriales archaeon]|nr:class I SAM-dependent methyltransferase family protein [Halobacteriales archaeon]